MSSYASRLRWQQRGILTRSEARERAPGFGRILWSSSLTNDRRERRRVMEDFHSGYDDDDVGGKENDVTDVDTPVTPAPTGSLTEVQRRERKTRELQALYLRDVLWLGEGVNFRNASVGCVLEWASRISGTDLSMGGVDWMLLDEYDETCVTRGDEGGRVDSSVHSTSSCLTSSTSSSQEEEKQIDYKYANSSHRHLVDDDILEGDEDVLWQKLKILLSAAYLARDEDDDDDEYLEHRPTNRKLIFNDSDDEEEDNVVCLREKDTNANIRFVESDIVSCATNLTTATSIDHDNVIAAASPTSTALSTTTASSLTPALSPPTSPPSAPPVRCRHVLARRRKMLLLYAAYFKLFPRPNVKQDVDDVINGKEISRREIALFKRSLRLCPQSSPGLTPLAIAASANANIFPSSFLLTFHYDTLTPASSLSPTTTFPDLLSLSRRIIDRMLTLSPLSARVPSHPSLLTPLHRAVSAPSKSWTDGISSLHAAYPSALRMTDAKGQTPLHRAASQNSQNVISKLVGLHPEATRVADNQGRLPLHLAAEGGRSWGEGVGDIFGGWPSAAVVPDKRGRLPAYYRVRRTTTGGLVGYEGGEVRKGKRRGRRRRVGSGDVVMRDDANTTLVQALLQNLVSKVQTNNRQKDCNNNHISCNISKIIKHSSNGGVMDGFMRKDGTGLVLFDSPMLPGSCCYYCGQQQQHQRGRRQQQQQQQERQKKCDGRGDLNDVGVRQHEGRWISATWKICV